MTDTLLLFGDPSLHGVLCMPADPARVTVLLIPPLFEERRCAHRAVITCARAMAEAGAAVLIPDLSGTGNSEGRLADVSLERWMTDLHAAAQALAERGGAGMPLLLIGCRAGALLAARAVAMGMQPSALLLWQPVLSGKSYFSQARTRRMVQEKMTGGNAPEVGPHEVEGHTLSPELYAELEALALPEAPPCADVRLLQCSFQEKLALEYERLAARWNGLRVRSVVAEPFWYPHTPGDYAELAAALAEEAHV